MHVHEMMSANPACCMPETRLQDVAKMMIEYDCGAIPVVKTKESGEPIGIVTDRDIVCRTVAVGLNPTELRARDAMTDLIVVTGRHTEIQECVDLMEEKQVRRLAIVDGEGRLCGIVAQADVARQAGGSETAELVRKVSKPTNRASNV